MANLFNMDNPIWRFMGKLVDVCILTVLWFACSLLWLPLTVIGLSGEQVLSIVLIISCLPCFFMLGPSSTAVYYVTMKLVKDEDSYTVRSFFKSFKQNFVQGGIIGLIMSALMAFFIYDIYAYFMMGSNLTFILGVIFIGIFLIYLITLVFVYPMQAKFYNKIRYTMRNAMLIGVKHIFRSLFMIIIAAAIIVGCLFFPPLILLSYGLIAFLQSYILVNIIQKYIPEEEEVNNEDSIVAEAMKELGEMPEEEPEHVVLSAPDPNDIPSNYFSREMLYRNNAAEDEGETKAIETEAQPETSEAPESEIPSEESETKAPESEVPEEEAETKVQETESASEESETKTE